MPWHEGEAPLPGWGSGALVRPDGSMLPGGRLHGRISNGRAAAHRMSGALL